MPQRLEFLLVTDVTASHSTDVKLASGCVASAEGYARLLDDARSATVTSMTETVATAVCVILRKIVPHFPSFFLCLEPTVVLRWQAFSFAPAMNQAPAELARQL
jgi:hypothetical protein